MRKNLSKLFFLLLVFGNSCFLQSRPLEDQVLLPPPKQKGVRILRNKNVTFTNDQAEERGGTGLIRTLYDVKGRSRPDRTGKVISQIAKDSIVTPFKNSKDGKWLAVIVRSSGIRAWIPVSTLPKLDNKFRLLKVVPQTSEEDE